MEKEKAKTFNFADQMLEISQRKELNRSGKILRLQKSFIPNEVSRLSIFLFKSFVRRTDILLTSDEVVSTENIEMGTKNAFKDQTLF